jgi:putative Ca2+/H+ antiporter (TMEM165/GDT1 family)
MWEFVLAVATATGVIFVAELGDKTQLLALGFGARHGLRTVAIGLTIGYATAGAIAALVGGILGAALPERPLTIAAGLLFIAFAVSALRRSAAHGDDDERVVNTPSVIASIALTIAIAEMGDKTQLATAAMASQASPLGTWLGATAGEVAAGMIGAIVGQRIGTRIHPRAIQIASAGLFAVFGLVLLLTAR